jgi:hypothetical protein
MKNNVKIPTKEISEKLFEKNGFFVGVLKVNDENSSIYGSESGSISQKHGSADPDPLKNVMDLQHVVPGWQGRSREQQWRSPATSHASAWTQHPGNI